MLLTCTKCKEVKDCSLFHKYDKKKNGFTSQCKACRNETRKQNYWKDPEASKKRRADYIKFLKETDPNKLFISNRNSKLKKAYGIDVSQYQKMLESQCFKCAVCNKEHIEAEKKRLVVDHCHTTNKIRGLLCNNCNTALGLLQENLDTINNLKNYILTYKQI